MGICYIVGAGEADRIDIIKKETDIIIAADAGIKHLEKSGLTADIIIGDFDSLGEIPSGENVIKLKPEKDVTDTYAAFEKGVELGYTNFRFYGVLGGRIDHSIANIQLLAGIAERKMTGVIYHDGKVFTSLSDGSISFTSKNKGYVSVFAHTDVCTGVYERGLKYPLDNATLKNTFPLGVSNEFTGKDSEITIGSGIAIVIYDLVK